MDYYSDNDPACCAWLEELVREGLIPNGRVECRDIREIDPEELAGYRRVHLFAGIGGWARALDLAGWPDEWPVWTGSCPCQPFSSAGKRRAERDERHLWLAFFRLIAECRPPVVAGEQVASRLGLEWLARVRADLEGAGYAVGAADLPAAGVGAPHKRQRLFWVAESEGNGSNGKVALSGKVRWGPAESGPRSPTGGLADAVRAGGRGDEPIGQAEERVADRRAGAEPGGLGDAGEQRRQGGEPAGTEAAAALGNAMSFWSDSRIVRCRDGKNRRVPLEPALFPLAPRLPGRVGLLRGAGNAICPQDAAAFLRAFIETRIEGLTNDGQIIP